MKWPLRRRKTAGGPDRRPGAEGVASGQRPPRRRPARDWLEPLQPVRRTTDPPVTVEAAGFVAALPSRQGMIHQFPPAMRSSAAPGGLVHVRIADKGVPASPLAAEPAGPGAGMVLSPLPPQWRVPVARAADVTRSSPAPLSLTSVSPAARADDAPVPPPPPVDEVEGAPALPSGPGETPDPGPSPHELSWSLPGHRPGRQPPPLTDDVPHDPERTLEQTAGSAGSGLAAFGRAIATELPSSGTSSAVAPKEGIPRATLANSRRLGLGPAYHGALPEAVQMEHHRRQAMESADVVEADGAEPGSAPGPGSDIEAVPDEVRTELRAATGVDVPVVHRGADVTREARDLGAIAYTKGGEVYVPREVGPLHRPPGRAVVAHEVVHASQQRQTGSILPPEDSAAGAALEAQAQSAERYFRGDPGAPAPSREVPARPDPSDGGSREAPALVHGQSRPLVPPGSARAEVHEPLVQAAAPPTPGVQRQTGPASTGPASTPTVDWNPVSSFAHAVSSDLQTFAEQVVDSSFGLSADVHNDMTRAANVAEREFAQNQYRQLRLEHRRTRFLAEHHQTALSPVDEHHIGELVDGDVTTRLQALQERVERRLIHERDADDRPLHVINRDEFRDMVARLFGDAATDAIPPDDTAGQAADSEHEHAHPQHDGHAETHRAGHPAVAAGAAGAAGARPSATHLAETRHAGGAPGGHDAIPASPLGGAGSGLPDGSSADPNGARPPAETGGSRSSTSSSAGGDSSGSGSQSTTERHLTVGEGFRHLAADVVADVALLDVGEWGLHLSEEESRQLRRDLHDPLATPPNAPSNVTPRSRTPEAEAAAAAPAAAAADSAAAPAAAASREPAAGVHPIGPAQAGQATASPTGHEHLDLDHLDLDELSDRLYHRLRRRLRTELLVDRERAGLLTDFR